MTKENRIEWVDKLLRQETKPTEFITSFITLGIAMRFISGGEDVYEFLGPDDQLILAVLPFIGIALMLAACGQLFGLAIRGRNHVALSRVMRWSSSIVDGCIWFSLLILVSTKLNIFEGLQWIYGALLLGDMWIVMGIAYRGCRGRDPD